MTIAERVRAGLEYALVGEMQRVSRELEAQAPVPDSTAPPIEELQRILADLQKRRSRRNIFLKGAS